MENTPDQMTMAEVETLFAKLIPAMTFHWKIIHWQRAQIAILRQTLESKPEVFGQEVKQDLLLKTMKEYERIILAIGDRLPDFAEQLDLRPDFGNAWPEF